MNNLYIYGGIIIIILIIIIYWFYFRKNYVHNKLTSGLQFMIDDYDSFISVDKIPQSKIGRKYTYGFWININNIPENSLWNEDFKYAKPIIFHYGSPNVYYLPKNHEVKISFYYKDKNNERSSYDFIIDNLDVQKWIHISIVVDTKNIDIYLDGELYGSTLLKNVHWIPNKFLYLGQKNNNFNGYLYNLEYLNINLNPKDVKNLYNNSKGNLPRNLPTYSNVFNKKNKTNN